MRKSVFTLLIVSIAFFGAGCLKSKDTQQSVVPQSNGVVQTETPAKTPEPIKASDPKAELIRAFEKFKNAKSYKAKYTMPTSQGMLSGTLAYSMPDRFKGTMELSPDAKTDVVLVQNSLYMRANDGAWVDISDSETAKKTIETMQLAVKGDQGLNSAGSDAWNVDSKTEDAKRGCWEYQVRIEGGENPDRNMSVCVKDGFPKFLRLESPRGEMNIEYLEYNTIFIIERPI
ncbi:MAG: hypothetical protein RDU25_03275 [Patescibacteria group bacterium]|nr:hypothetical protein [Patescibacteria group bacterium]